MKLKLEFEDGSIKFVRLPSKPVRVSYITPRLYTDESDKTFAGLWITDTNLFVEVISAREAYTLSSAGARSVRCQVDKSGVLFIDRAKACKLMLRRVGFETFVKGTSLEWPSIATG